jgi:hypothetical protein
LPRLACLEHNTNNWRMSRNNFSSQFAPIYFRAKVQLTT